MQTLDSSFHKALRRLSGCDHGHSRCTRESGSVLWAKLAPFGWMKIGQLIEKRVTKVLTRHRVGSLRLIDPFGEHDSKTSLEMEINMAVKEPGTSVVSL